MVSILKVSIRQLKAARTLLGWSQEELASSADCLTSDHKALGSRGRLAGGRQTTAHKIQDALEKAGIEFIDENGGGPACGCASASGPNHPSKQ